MRYLVIVNGKSGNGKTTFNEMCADYINKSEYAYPHIVSSIDFVKEIAYKMGWNGEKNEKSRQLLSDLKKIWIEFSNGPMAYAIKMIMNTDNISNHVFFMDIREIDEIEKIRSFINYNSKILNVCCITVAILKDGDLDRNFNGNKSDDGVFNMVYDYYISNSGTREDLYNNAIKFVDNLIG